MENRNINLNTLNMVIQYFPTVVVELPKLATKSSMTFHMVFPRYNALFWYYLGS